MKRKAYAIIKVTLVRQVEFETEENADVEDMAIKAAEKEFRIEQRADDEPQNEEVEVLECDWAD